MPRPDPEQGLLPSILDRLIDREPKVSTEPPAGRAQLLEQLKESVKRDLEWLLNTKQSIVQLPAGAGHLARSLLSYGVPDFTTASLTLSRDQDQLRRAIEETIRLFEPRLLDIQVSLVEGHESERRLRFRI